MDTWKTLREERIGLDLMRVRVCRGGGRETY